MAGLLDLGIFSNEQEKKAQGKPQAKPAQPKAAAAPKAAPTPKAAPKAVDSGGLLSTAIFESGKKPAASKPKADPKLQGELSRIDKAIAKRKAELQGSTLKRTVSKVGDFLDPFEDGDAVTNELLEARKDITNQMAAGRKIPVTASDVGREIVNAPARGIVGAGLGMAAGAADVSGDIVRNFGRITGANVDGGSLEETAANLRDVRRDFNEKYAAPESASQNRYLRGAGQVAEAVGSTVPYLVTGLPGRAAKVIGGVAAFGGGADEQNSRVEAQLAQGRDVSEGQEFASEILGGGVGLLELAPVKALLSKVPQGYGNRVVKMVSDRLAKTPAARIVGQLEKTAGGRVAGAALEEGVQEAAAGVAQDLIELGIYNPDAAVGDNALQDFALGAAAGGIIRTGVEGVRAATGTTAETPPPGSDDIATPGLADALRTTLEGAEVNSNPTPPLPIENQVPIRLGGMNLTQRQVLEFGEQNADNPTIQSILSQPADDATKAENIARVFNENEAKAAEARVVERVGPYIGGKTSVSNTRALIQETLSPLDAETIAASPILSTMKEVADNPKLPGNAVVKTLRDAVKTFRPVGFGGETAIAVPNAEGTTDIAGPNQLSAALQGLRERQAQEEQQNADTVYENAFNTIEQDRQAAQQRTEETARLGTEALIGRRIKTDQLPGEVRQRVETRAIQLGLAVPESFTQDQLARIPGVDAASIFGVQQPAPQAAPQAAPDMAISMPQAEPQGQPAPQDDMSALNQQPQVVAEEQPAPVIEETAVVAPAAPAPVVAPSTESPVDGAVEQAVRSMADTVAPEQDAAPAQEPAPVYTPQQVADNLLAFAGGEADARGLDNAQAKMFREGVRDVARGAEPMADEQVLSSGGKPALKAYKDGIKWAKQKKAEAKRAGKPKKADQPKPQFSTREEAPQQEDVAAEQPDVEEDVAAEEQMSGEEAQSIIDEAFEKLKARGQLGRVASARIQSLIDNKALSVNEAIAAFRMADVATKIVKSKLSVDIQFVPDLRNEAGEGVQGSFQSLPLGGDGFAGVLKLSLAEEWSGIFTETAAHESFHVLQRVLQKADPKTFKLLNSSFKDGMTLDDIHPSLKRMLKNTRHPRFQESVWDIMQGDSVFRNEDGSMRQWSGYGANPDTITELQAYVFGYFNDAIRYGASRKGVAAQFTKAYDLFANFLEAVRNAVNGLGFTSTSKLWRDAASGALSERVGDVDISADGGENVQFSARTKADPVRTQKAYKLFRVDEKKPGQLFPLFVKANEPVQMGQWLDAESGEMVGDKVKSKLGPLAYRPGWHGGDLPIATHIGAKSDAKLKAPDTRPDNQVWAEVEFAADRDWQAEADRRAKRNKNGDIIANTAHITDQIPEDGFYRYKTNPNMTGNWLISGSMKVNRILTDAEVKQINDAANAADLPRKTAFDAAKYGFDGPQYSSRKVDNNGEFKKNIKASKLSADELFNQPDVKQGAMNVTEAALAMQARTLSILGRPITSPGQQDTLLAQTVAHEVKSELSRSGKRNASGWYTEEMRKASAVASLLHPEIATDVGAQLHFTAALAITSQNQSVDFNSIYAERWYDFYKKNGKFPENEGWGKAASSIMSNAKLFNALVERYGAESVAKFFATKFTVRELKAAGFDNVSGAAEEMVYGSAVLGPKIGFGFYSNLNGRYDPITIDMWFMRTWGRMTGDLIGVDPELVEAQEERLRKALADEGRPTNAYGEQLVEVAREVSKAFEKDFKDNRADYDSKKKVKPESALAAQRLLSSFEDTKDAPKADWQRTWIRNVVAEAQQILQKDGINITNADLQAILWYPEKRLWSKKFGVREKGKGADDAGSAGETSYYDEFVRIAKSRGFTDAQINAAVQPNGGRGQGSGSVLGGQAVNQQAGGQSSAANGFAPGEGRRFIQNSVIARLNKEFPIFNGAGGATAGGPSEHVKRTAGGRLASSVEGRVPVSATYSHSSKVKNALEVAGIDAPKFYELTPGAAAAKLYHRLISAAQNANKAGAAVYVYDQPDYADMRLFLTEDGLTGFALKGDDVVSVFKHPNSTSRNVAIPLARMAVWLGGRRLDAYDTVLPYLYSTAGFRVSSRMLWDDGQASDLWDKATFSAFNDGEPDVVFMHYDQSRSDFYQKGEGELFDDYDAAVEKQKADAAANGPQFSSRRAAPTGTPVAKPKPENIRLNAPKFKDGPTVLGTDTRSNAMKKWGEYYEKFVNRTLSIKQLTKNIDDQWNDETNISRAEQLMGSRAAEQTKDFHVTELRKLLQEIGMRGLTIDEVEKYLHNLHAQERNAVIRERNEDFPDGGSGIKDADAQAYLAAIPADKRKRLDAVAKKVNAITQQTLKILEESGVESADTAAILRETYKNYVPLFREGVDGGQPLGTRGANVEGSALKAAVGSSKPVENILANIILQREAAIHRAEANRLGNTVMRAALEAPDQNFWLVIDPSKASLEQVRKQLAAMGMDPDLAQDVFKSPKKRTYNKRTGTVETTVDTAFKMRPNVVATRVDGTDKYIVFNPDNEMAAKVAAVLRADDLPAVDGAMGNFINAIGPLTRMWSQLRTQYMPEFGPVNFARDLQGVMLNMMDTPVNGMQGQVAADAVKFIKPLISVIGRSDRGVDQKQKNAEVAELFERFEKAGGRTAIRESFFKDHEQNPEALEKELEQAIKQLKTGKRSAPDVVVDGVTAWNDALENATRLAVFKAAIDKGLTDAQAAEIAKNISVNFNQRGQFTREMNALYGFFNASIASTDRNVRLMLSPVGKKILISGIGLGITQAMMLAAAGYEDDDIPEWVKDHAFIIPLPFTDRYAAIPMPYFYNMFPAIGRRMVEVARGQLTIGEFLTGTLKTVINSVNPIAYGAGLIEFVSPSVADMFVQYWQNEDGLGRKIYNENFNELSPTTGMSRAKGDNTVLYSMYSKVAEVINDISGGDEYTPGKASPTPEEIKFFVEQMFPPIQFVYRSFSTVQKAAQGDDVEANDIAFVRRFYGQTSGKTAEGGKFYENVKEMNEIKSAIKQRQEEGVDTTEYTADKPGYQASEYVSQYYRDVSALRKERRQMILEGQPAADIRAKDEAITAKMKEFNDLVEDFKTADE